MKYAKDNAGTLQYPTASEFPGVPNALTHDSLLRRHGYMPLVGEAEPHEGYNAIPATWHTVTQSETRTEPRQVLVPDIDPETGEKTGEHYEMQDKPVVYDTSYIQIDTWDYIPIPPPEPEPVTYEDYDNALEEYLKEVRCSRGYTSREPELYADSSVERWAQDARDWTAFRDQVMLYGLDKLNEYASTGVPPCTLDEFRAALREIECHWTYADEVPF